MKNRTVVGVLAIVMVAGLVIAGLVAIGSPTTARNLRADQERRDRLGQLHMVLASHVRIDNALPGSLDEVSDEALRQSFVGFDPRRDPESDDYFEYRTEGDRRYEVCAEFLTSSEDRRAREFGRFPGDVSHEPGRNCYEREITDFDVESAPVFGPGFEFPAPVPRPDSTPQAGLDEAGDPVDEQQDPDEQDPAVDTQD